MNSAAVDICRQVFVWTDVFISLGRYLGVEFLGHVVTMFNLLSGCQTAVQRGCTAGCLHEGYEVPVAVCPPLGLSFGCSQPRGKEVLSRVWL